MDGSQAAAKKPSAPLSHNVFKFFFASHMYASECAPCSHVPSACAAHPDDTKADPRCRPDRSQPSDGNRRCTGLATLLHGPCAVVRLLDMHASVQVLMPRAWVPSFARDLLEFYVANTQDHLMATR